MTILSELRYLLYKEFLIEFRNKTAVSGILLYVAATVYVSYLSFRNIVDVPTWNALYWIIVLFAAFNGAGRSFDKETFGRELYLYQLARAESIILSKTLFNVVLMISLTFSSLLLYVLLLGSKALVNANYPMLFLGLLMASFGFASLLTLIAGIAYKTENNIGISAILGMPVILPFLLTLIRYSKNAIDGIAWSVNLDYLLVLLLLNVVIMVLSYLLFPYIWRD